MQKIKIAIVTKNLEMTGISSVIMNYITYLDKKKYDLTVIAGSKINEKYLRQCKQNKVLNFQVKCNDDNESLIVV